MIDTKALRALAEAAITDSDGWATGIYEAAASPEVVLALLDCVEVLPDLLDPGPCRFDHHGGCQEHGYLDLEPGEMCPQAVARAALARLEVTP